VSLLLCFVGLELDKHRSPVEKPVDCGGDKTRKACNGLRVAKRISQVLRA